MIIILPWILYPEVGNKVGSKSIDSKNEYIDFVDVTEFYIEKMVAGIGFEPMTFGL